MPRSAVAGCTRSNPSRTPCSPPPASPRQPPSVTFRCKRCPDNSLGSALLIVFGILVALVFFVRVGVHAIVYAKKVRVRIS